MSVNLHACDPPVVDNHDAVVFGAGAVGGYLGARLAAAVPPWQITLVGRPSTVEAIDRDGVRVVGIEPSLRVYPRAYTLSDVLEPVSFVILTVRSDDVGDGLKSLRRLVSTGGTVLAVQNGVGTEDLLADALGPRRVIAAALTTSIVIEAPGVIRRTGRTDGIGLATLDGSPMPAWIPAAFQSTGMEVAVVDDVRSLRWSKLLLNMIGAPISAILDVDIGAIMADAALFRAEQLAFREATRVMDKLNVRTVDLPGYPVRLARLAMRLPRPVAQRLLAQRITGARGGRSPGMRADMHRNRSEINSFHGAIVSTGRRVHVRTPVCAALAELTRALVSERTRRDAFRQQPDALVAWLRGRGIDM